MSILRHRQQFRWTIALGIGTLVCAVLGFSALLFAGVEERTIHVFPSGVSASPDWVGHEQSLRQELSQQAVLEDFSDDNAAVIRFEAVQEEVFTATSVQDTVSPGEELSEEDVPEDRFQPTDEITDQEYEREDPLSRLREGSPIAHVMGVVGRAIDRWSLTPVYAQEESDNEAADESAFIQHEHVLNDEDEYHTDEEENLDVEEVPAEEMLPALEESADEEVLSDVAEIEESSGSADAVTEEESSPDPQDDTGTDQTAAPSEEVSGEVRPAEGPPVEADSAPTVARDADDERADEDDREEEVAIEDVLLSDDSEVSTTTTDDVEQTTSDAMVPKDALPGLSSDDVGVSDSAPRSADTEFSRICEVRGDPCHILTFDGFSIGAGMPLSTLKNMQLKLSLAAFSEGDTYQDDKVYIRYLHRGQWFLAGELTIAGELSNRTNGGHFRYDLPEMRSWSDLDALTVEIEYVRNGTARTELFVDGVWLDAVFTAEVDPELDAPNVQTELQALEQSARNDILLLEESDELIHFVHEGAGEALRLRADAPRYERPGTTHSYVSVTNEGSREASFRLHAHFPREHGEVVSFSQRMANVPITVETPQYGDLAQFCDAGWEPVGTATEHEEEHIHVDDEEGVFPTDEEIEVFDAVTATSGTGTVPFDDDDAHMTAYLCQDTGEIRSCDAINTDGTNCILEGQFIGGAEDIEYRSAWQPHALRTGVDGAHSQTLFDRLRTLFGFEHTKERAELPRRFARMQSTEDEYRVMPGQTLYFKLALEYPILSRGEFVLEVEQEGETLDMLSMDWQSDWHYRVPIELGAYADMPRAPLVLLQEDAPHFFEHRSVDSDELLVLDGSGVDVVPHVIEYDADEELSLTLDMTRASTTERVYLYYGRESAPRAVHDLSETTELSAEEASAQDSEFKDEQESISEPGQFVLGESTTTESLPEMSEVFGEESNEVTEDVEVHTEEAAETEEAVTESVEDDTKEDAETYGGFDAAADAVRILPPEEAVDRFSAIHKLRDDRRSVRTLEQTRFDFSYLSQKEEYRSDNFVRIPEDDSFSIERVELVHVSGKKVESLSFAQYPDARWSLSLDVDVQQFKPGKYMLTVESEEDGELYVDTQPLYFGVLALNTTRSVYRPHDEVEIHMAALTEQGHTICRADLGLFITDPDGLVQEVAVTASQECDGDTVIEEPDYWATYTVGESGTYTIRMVHYRNDGSVLREIHDAFEVRDEVPYTIEREGPTRIYPLAPYRMTLRVTAHEPLDSVLEEIVPGGFLFLDRGDGEAGFIGDHKTLSWHVELEPGETAEFTYEFDAPNRSPYLYLLGPASIDGDPAFTEARLWQIASDALPMSAGVAFLTATSTTDGANLNVDTPVALLWSEHEVDDAHYTYSESVNPERLTVTSAGDYLVALTLPVARIDGNNRRTRIQSEVHVNGVAVSGALGRSSYIRNGTNHTHSSNHVHVLLRDLSPNDYIEVYVSGVASLNAADIVEIRERATLAVEFVSSGERVFSATATETSGGTNFNPSTPETVLWDQGRVDVGYEHSDSASSDEITINDPGRYLVYVNIPLESTVQRANVRGRVLLDGAVVPGGHFQQGYIRNSGGDIMSSAHWSGVVETTDSDQILSIDVAEVANSGTVTVGGSVASIYIQRVPMEDTLLLRATQPTGGTDWNVSPAQALRFDEQVFIDTDTFSHSTTTDGHEVTVERDGDYTLVFNSSVTSGSTRNNQEITVHINGTPVQGAYTATHYIRNDDDHNEASGSLVYFFRNLVEGDVIEVYTQQEAGGGTAIADEDALLFLWRKKPQNIYTQNHYRWYVNVDGVTPVSPWPPGPENLAENEPIGDEEAVALGDVLRLRMSLNTVATSTAGEDSFKLQFAQGVGEQCTLALDWQDVGAVGSSAAWRGFENPMVGAPIFPSDWFDEDWGHRIELTIQSSQVDATLTDFPVYVNLSDLDPAFFDEVRTDGGDMRVTTSDGETEVPREVVFINTGSSTGELHFRAPSLSPSSDTTFYLYYGNPSGTEPAATAANGRNAVWDDNFVAVHHLEGTTSSVDSSGTGNDGVYENGLPQTVAGQLGDAQDFGTPSQQRRVRVPHDSSLDISSQITVEAWANLNALSSGTGNIRTITNKQSASHTDRNWWLVHWDERWRFRASPGTPTIFSDALSATGQWVHLAVTGDGSTWRMYVDGEVQGTTQSYSSIDTQPFPMWIGVEAGSDRPFDGLIDEVRISNTARSGAWIAATHRNQATTTDFYTASSPEGSVSGDTQFPDNWYDSAWSSRAPITIPAASISATLTDFPLYIDLAHMPAEFFDEVRSDGADIRVTSANGTTLLAWELVELNVASSTGELHFKAPSLSHTTDTTFFIYWGNASAVDAQSPEDVWSDDFVLVQHLQEDSGAGDFLIDSSPEGNDGAPLGTTPAFNPNSIIGGGYSFSGNNQQRVEIPDDPSLQLSSALTASAWARANSWTTPNHNPVLWKGTQIGWGANFMFRIAVTDGASPTWGVTCGSTEGWFPGGSVTTGDWYHYTITFDGTIARAYINGAQVATDTSCNGQSLNVFSGSPVRSGFGLRSTLSEEVHWDGDVDEIRMASVARSAAWIAAEYENVANASTFYSIGPASTPKPFQLPVLLLSESDVAQTYEEQNPSATTTATMAPDENGEWDWVLQNNDAEVGALYCFRMVLEDGTPLRGYNFIPQLVTTGPPTGADSQRPFPNEVVDTTTPAFDFRSFDPQNNDLHYQIQIASSIDFTTPILDDNSISSPLIFNNVEIPADKAPFNSGQTIRYIAQSALTQGNTYWWRVRARDPGGSDTWGAWSESESFTVDTTIENTTWRQRTGEQFDTDVLEGVETTGSDTVVLSTGETEGTLTTTEIFFPWGTENAWGEIMWTDNQTNGEIRYVVEYLEGGSWDVVPNSALLGNEGGFTTSPINIFGLSPSTYQTLRVRAEFTDAGGSPSLADIRVVWGDRVAQPDLFSPFSHEKVATSTPTFTFETIDPNDGDLIYQLEWSTDRAFQSGVTTKTSDVDSGFANVTTPADTSPFNSGDRISFTVASGDALSEEETYWWRVRARDPGGGDEYSEWSERYSVTIATSTISSTWFQTTAEQFQTGTLVLTQATSGEVVLGSDTGNHAVYRAATAGENMTTALFDHTWDTTVVEQDNFALTASNTIALDAGHYAVFYGSRFSSAGGTNRSEHQTHLRLGDVDLPFGWSQGYIRRGSGANDAFTSGGAIIRADNDGDELRLRSFRTDENPSALTVRANDASAIQMVRLDSSWPYARLAKTTTQTGPTSPGWVAVTYNHQEELDTDAYSHSSGSGNLVLHEPGTYLVFANTYGSLPYGSGQRSIVNQRLTLDGSPVSGSYTSVYLRGQANENATHEGAASLGMLIEAPDPNMTLRVELNRGVGTVGWTINQNDAGQYVNRTGLTVVRLPDGIDTIRLQDTTGQDINPASITPFSWNTQLSTSSVFTHSVSSDPSRVSFNEDGSYLFFSALWVEESSVQRSVSNLGWGINGGGLLPFGQTSGYGRNSGGAEAYGHFAGTVFSGASSGDYIEALVRAIGASGSVAAAQTGIQGTWLESWVLADTRQPTITSPDITFTDGIAQAWGRVYWSDTTPGDSSIIYRVLYQTAGGGYELIPDGALPGNAAGTSTGPIDISFLDVETYGVLRIQATLVCDGGDCPSLQDWTVEWSEGISVSGVAFEYDQITPLTEGTVAIAVNGVLQTDKTGEIGSDAIQSDWYDELWQYRKTITIDSDEIDDTLTDFPVLVSITDADLSGKALANGNDILFTSDNGTTKLDHEIETYDSTTGELIAWVRVPTVSDSSDTDIFLYYGNPSSASQQNPSGVWSNEYLAVWHLRQDSATETDDSTGNSNDGTFFGTNMPNTVDGQVGPAQEFDGLTDYVAIPNSFGVFDGSRDFTIEGWFNANAFPINDAWQTAAAPISLRGERSLMLTTADGASSPNRLGIRAQLSPGGWTTVVETDALSTDTWYHVVATFNTTNGWVLYQDGVEIDSNSVTASIDTDNAQSSIGAETVSGTNRFFNGVVDEVRFSTTTRSAAWVSASFANQSDPATFLSVGAEEEVGEGSVSGWTIPNVTVVPGDVVHVFLTDRTGMERAVAVTKYAGGIRIAGMELHEGHLSLGSNDNPTLSVDEVGLFDNTSSGLGAVLHEVDGSGDLDVCGQGSCTEARLWVRSGTTFAPASSGTRTISAHDIHIEGIVLGGANIFDVSRTWRNEGSFTPQTSTVRLSATSGTGTIDSTGASASALHNVIFGTAASTATWAIPTGLVAQGALTLAHGTLSPASSTIAVAGNFTIGANGIFEKGTATTTLNGSGLALLTDNTSGQDLGIVHIAGSSKTVRLAAPSLLTNLTIASGNTFDVSTGNHTLAVRGDFINNGTFTARNGTVLFTATSTGRVVSPGPSPFYDMTFDGNGGMWAFPQTNVTAGRDVTIENGTVTFPTGVFSIGGSFINTAPLPGGFMHNNGTVTFTSTQPGRVVEAGGDDFYRLRFNGVGGTWSMLDAQATTSENFIISRGTVTMPSERLTVFGDFEVVNGAFDHNEGEVQFLTFGGVEASIQTNNSTFYDVRFDGDSGGAGEVSWFDTDWSRRVPLVIQASQVEEELTDFPVYIDLSRFYASTSLFSLARSDGGDIRITESDGTTEVPREMVSFATSSGELHFLAPTLSDSSDTTFYLYYGNPDAEEPAATAPNGPNAVWDSNYVAVHHLASTSAPVDSSGTGNNGTWLGGLPQSVAGAIGTAHNFGTGSQDRRVEIPWDSSLNMPSTITVEAWAYLNALSTGDSNIRVITSKQQNSGNRNWWLVHWNSRWQFRISPGSPTIQSNANSAIGQWVHLAVTGDGSTLRMYVDGVLQSSTASYSSINTQTQPMVIGTELGTSRHFDGLIDEVRISNTNRSGGWIATTYANHSDQESFFAELADQQILSRTFIEANATVERHVVIEGGEVVFPADTLFVGGSFSNEDGLFDANGGTVHFNATTTGFSIDPGQSPFYRALFDSTAGGWTVTGNATTTNEFRLEQAGTFVADTGVRIAVSGTFVNNVHNASTTWSGSTLAFVSSTSYTVGEKTSGQETYGTLELDEQTHIRMWNASADAYDVRSGSSLYSQDHAAQVGELYIFGDYARSSGTDHWSWATDFDGTSLDGSERQALVYLADDATARYRDDATLSIIGTTTATSTIDRQVSGGYSVVIDGGTIDAHTFSFSGMDEEGVQIVGSSTVTNLEPGFFELTADGGTMLTLASTTVDANPAYQPFDIGFATSSGIASGFNVTLLGEPSSFWWFREAYGNYAGEAFDNDPGGDPGFIRWDDSSFLITVSGVVYDDLGTTPSAACPATVRVVVDDVGYTTSCAAGTGEYTIEDVAYSGDVPMIAYLDTNGGARGATVSRTPTGDVSGFDIYRNYTIVRHEDVAPITNTQIATYDGNDDSDIPFTVSGGNLATEPGTGLYVWDTKTFAPGGELVLAGGAGGDADGTLRLGTEATLTAVGSPTYEIGGSWIAGSDSVFNRASSLIVFTATSSGKSLLPQSAFNTVAFTGVGGEWSIDAPMTVVGDVAVDAGELTGTSDLTIQTGTLTGNGSIAMTGGTVTLEESSALGGATPWTFNHLTFGNGATTTTQKTGTNDITVSGVLTIENNHALEAGSDTWRFTGSGTVLHAPGTFDAQTSTVSYEGEDALIIAPVTYYDLIAQPSAGDPTYTLAAGGIAVTNDMTIGNGTHGVTVTANTNDPFIVVSGDVWIRDEATMVASNVNDWHMGGSYLNEGTLTAPAGGTIVFNASSTGHTIAAGDSSFADVRFIHALGGWTLTENATSTGLWAIEAANSFAVDAGVTLAVGGIFENAVGSAATTWTDSVLALNGTDDHTVNPKTVSDTYATLRIGPSAKVRMWGSSATQYEIDPSGFLYSKDHAGVAGDLYVWGAYVNSGSDDHWSYETDFDGEDISTTSPRQARVYFAENASAYYSGGSLSMVGTSTATTTVQNQGTGTYALVVGSGTLFTGEHVRIRDIDADGLTFTGTPTVDQLRWFDLLLEQEGGTMITVGGTAITENPLKTFRFNTFATSTGITSGFNVTATGTAESSWRFTQYFGNYAGEAFDNDPDGDPGYIVWDDSDANITVAGRVYSDEGVTVSGLCDDTTNVVRVVVAGVDTFNTSCASADGAYSIQNIGFSAGDTITVYLATSTARAANVTRAPVTNINTMHLYENRMIVRHEDTDPMTIAALSVYEQSNDANIPFTATIGSPNTLELDAGMKLIVWNGKTFAPGGTIAVPPSGTTAAHDGAFELRTGAQLVASGVEVHTIGGSFLTGSGASVSAASSTLRFTSPVADRIIAFNASPVHTLEFDGAGAWMMTDSAATTTGSLRIEEGTVTLPTQSLSVGDSLINSGGAFSAGTSTTYFRSATSSTITQGGSDLHALFVTDGGSYAITDMVATSTGDVIVASGTIMLASERYTIGGSLDASTGTLISSQELRFTSANAGETISAPDTLLGGMTFAGAGSWTFADAHATSSGSVRIEQGSVTAPSEVLAIAGSFDNLASSTSFNANAGLLRFIATTTGYTVTSGGAVFSDVEFDGAGGGWTVVDSATSTGYWYLLVGDSYTQAPGTTLEVSGVFNNLIGAPATAWNGSTLYLNAGTTTMPINTKTVGGDTYDTLRIGTDTQVRMWNSSATTTLVDTGGSLYSQDHGGVDGALSIWGAYTRESGIDHWSYATDFDGASLVGGERAVSVRIASSSEVAYEGGSLSIIGSSGNRTDIAAMDGGTYALSIATGGTFTAEQFAVEDLDAQGLVFIGAPTVTTIANGSFTLSVDAGTLITVPASTINANPTKTFPNNEFSLGSVATGTNVTRTGETSNTWTFAGAFGTLASELFDIDGTDDCGAIRWPDSTCLEVSQQHFRFRADNGGEGSPADEWFDDDWGLRKRVTILNDMSADLVDQPVRIELTYESEMLSDFADLRFTDASGTTTIPYYFEEITNSVSAVVWVQVPFVPGNGAEPVYVYYDNAFVVSTESIGDVFLYADDFEGNTLAGYSGDTGLFDTTTTFAYLREYGLSANPGDEDKQTTSGIYRTGSPTGRDTTLRFFQYVDASEDDEPCVLFAVQGAGENYAVCLDQFPASIVSIARDVTSSDNTGTILASESISYTTGWYEVEVDWLGNGDINVAVYDDSGTEVATVSTNDTTYTSGGHGFSFWFQHGGWDFVSVRPYIEQEPSFTVSTPQAGGGASWLADQNMNLVGQEFDQTFRTRISVENSGPPITDQAFRLQYAPKGGAPTCEAVDPVAFNDVPNQASCGLSAVCMTSSPEFSDQTPTTQLLDTIFPGTFVSGRMIESPSNQSGLLNLAQDSFTELEYALAITSNASDSAYCLRVTDGGLPLDTYARIPEIQLTFDPTLGDIVLNADQSIALTEATTTPIIATTTVSDGNGFEDIVGVSATFYRTGVAGAETCTANDNNCYQLGHAQCPLTNCSGNTCDVTCTADIWYFAEPTDPGSAHESESWVAYLEAIDSAGGTATGTAESIDLLTLRALRLLSDTIAFGTLNVGEDTGAVNAVSTIRNTGNASIDVDVAGTDLEAPSSVIPAGNVLVATTTFTYDVTCSICEFLSGTSTTFVLDLPKPTTDSAPVLSDLYWGIAIPFNTAGLTHYGMSVFTAVGD